jgi:hypothetical protein
VAGPAGLDVQARQALARWDEAVARHGTGLRFVPVGSATSQVGDWEPGFGDNAKAAAISGLLDAEPGVLPAASPGSGQVRWLDGQVLSLPLLSADATLRAMKENPEGRCRGCNAITPLRVVGARLATVTMQTDRGQATVPAWEFALAGTGVRISRIAIGPSAAVTVTPPPWDPNNPPGGLAVESATVAADGRTVTASFTGSSAGTGPCTADYTARAVESDHAAVIIIDEHQHGDGQQVCTMQGYSRTATAMLATPLGERTLLEVRQGTPIPTTRQ